MSNKPKKYDPKNRELVPSSFFTMHNYNKCIFPFDSHLFLESKKMTYKKLKVCGRKHMQKFLKVTEDSYE